MGQEYKCDHCGKVIIGEPYYSNYISGDDYSASYDLCSTDCLLNFIADKMFDILNKRE